MSSYSKTIVCLANSRKLSGRCVAGKVYENGRFGEWVRPISNRPNEEISEEDRRYRDGRRADVLHIVDIPMKEPTPYAYQVENHLIDDDYYWSCSGQLTVDHIADAVDQDVDALWLNGCSSYSGVNDRVPLKQAASLQTSLVLIQPDTLTIRATAEGAEFGDMQRKTRARFDWRGVHYALRVTDPTIEELALSDPEREQQFKRPYVCVSLGEPYNDFAYKLVAAVIT